MVTQKQRRFVEDCKEDFECRFAVLLPADCYWFQVGSKINLSSFARWFILFLLPKYRYAFSFRYVALFIYLLHSLPRSVFLPTIFTAKIPLGATERLPKLTRLLIQSLWHCVISLAMVLFIVNLVGENSASQKTVLVRSTWFV